MQPRHTSRLIACLLVSACHASAASPPPEVPARIEVVDSEHATRTRDPWAPRYIQPEHAEVPPPVAAADEPPCVEEPPDDSIVIEAQQREHQAVLHPPAVHCHIYIGEHVERHLGIRGGQRTNLHIGSLLVELGFRIDEYEGSSFDVEVRHYGQTVLRYGRRLWLAHMPKSCAGTGFSGWLRPAQAPELALYCESAP